MAKPKVLVLVERAGWSFYRIALELQRGLAGRFEVEVRTPLDPAPDAGAFDVAVTLWYGHLDYLHRLRPDARFVSCLFDDYTWRCDPVRRGKLYGALRSADALLLANEGFRRTVLPVLPRPLPPVIGSCEDGVDLGLYHRGAPRPDNLPLRVGWAGTTAHGAVKGLEIIRQACAHTDRLELDLALREVRWRTPEEMADWYRTLDVYVCASSCEGTPNPILEASASGLPWVSTNVGLVPELFATGIDLDPAAVPPGVIIPRDTPVLRRTLLDLAADPARRVAMGTSGRRAVEAGWSWATRVGGYAEAIQAVLDQPVRRRAPPEPVPPLVEPPLDGVPGEPSDFEARLAYQAVQNCSTVCTRRDCLRRRLS